MFLLLSAVSCRVYIRDNPVSLIALVMDESQRPQPRVAQAQAAIDAENPTAPPQEQPQAQSAVQAQPNAEPVPDPASLSEVNFFFAL